MFEDSLPSAWLRATIGQEPTPPYLNSAPSAWVIAELTTPGFTDSLPSGWVTATIDAEIKHYSGMFLVADDYLLEVDGVDPILSQADSPIDSMSQGLVPIDCFDVTDLA